MAGIIGDGMQVLAWVGTIGGIITGAGIIGVGTDGTTGAGMVALVGAGMILFLVAAFTVAGAGITAGAGTMLGLETDFIMVETHHLTLAEEVVIRQSTTEI